MAGLLSAPGEGCPWAAALGLPDGQTDLGRSCRAGRREHRRSNAFANIQAASGLPPALGTATAHTCAAVAAAMSTGTIVC